MCEYCGCQSVPAIGELADEHERALELVAQARVAHRDGDLARMAHVAQRLADLLAPHFAVEEEGLFPVLEREFPEQVAALRREHAALTAVLAGAGDVPLWDCSWAARILGALDLLQWHVLKEQDGVFPAALATLHSADWEALDAVRDRIGSKLAHPVGA